MATIDPSAMDGTDQSEATTLLPVLVLSTHGADDDELLFSPDSEGESVTPGLGTPPTPEERHFVWPRNQTDARIDSVSRPVEPATEPLGAFDVFVDPPNSPSSDLGAIDEENVSVRRSSIVSTIVEDGDNEERLSMVSHTTTTSACSSSAATQPDSLSIKGQSLKLNAKLQSVKEKQRDALSRFQMKGGLVGWLHGENDDETATEPPVPPLVTEKSAEAAAPRKQGSSLFGNLYDKMRRQQEQLELKLQQFDQPTGNTTAEYNHSRAARPTQPRLSLPVQIPRQARGDEDHIGFGDFVSSGQQSRPPGIRRDSRMRSASSSEVYQPNPAVAAAASRLRSLSFATRPSRTDTSSSTAAASALQLDTFPMEECLADPKLAAEFMNVALPGDEWLLTLLYSIEEYEALTTASSAGLQSGESGPTLETQITMAFTIVDRFLVDAVAQKEYAPLAACGAELRGIVGQYQRPLLSPTSAAVAPTVPPTNSLPMTLFDDVYAFVFNKLRDAYDTKFRLTREYTQLLAHRQQDQMAMTDEKALQHLVLTFDQVIESEWCCTVFWVFLFRTSHHHRLSFIMDVKFKLRRLYVAAQQTPPDSPLSTGACRHLQHEILLICRRYLAGKNAAISLPITSVMLTRLRDELCLDAANLEDQGEPSLPLMRSMVDKLDAMRTQTRADFKRMSFERFASFLTSAMYRDFIVQPASGSSSATTRTDDLMQLLRLNRIPFHQPPVSLPDPGSLSALCDKDGDAIMDGAVATAFAFRGNLGCESVDHSRCEHRFLVVSSQETTDSVQSLAKTVESFLLPESSPKATGFANAAKLPAACFNFLAGTGESSVYGAVWRFPINDSKASADGSGDVEKNVHGVCVLSRLPLIDGLRAYLRGFASQLDGTPQFFADEPGQVLDDALAHARDALMTHCKAASAQACVALSSMPRIDTSLQDLFECLSITHIIRLFSLVLQEKKIVLVASSYSVLLCVGESLRAIIRPLLWSHIYVPVLPMSMKGYLHCPTPFIFGLHTSYVRQCELPKATDDLAIVNLDRDSITGGGDVFLPPLRSTALRDRLVSLCKPRLFTRDQIACASHAGAVPAFFPSEELRSVFHEELREILRHLEAFAFRFECADRTISVVDTSNKSRQWPADAARFYSVVLQTQAFSSFLGRNKLE